MCANFRICVRTLCGKMHSLRNQRTENTERERLVKAVDRYWDQGLWLACLDHLRPICFCTACLPKISRHVGPVDTNEAGCSGYCIPRLVLRMANKGSKTDGVIRCAVISTPLLWWCVLSGLSNKFFHILIVSLEFAACICL
jgi:hypothetical protein